MGSVRRAGFVAALAAAPLGLAYRFALAYRARAGYPRRHRPAVTPADLGMAFESITVPAGDVQLPGWFIPAPGGLPGPAVALIHGWESARDRTLPNVLFLHAAGFHCLTIDVRGHGDNVPERLPISAGEFGRDALAAFQALMERPEVTTAGLLGHSMGAIGAILAAGVDARVAALVSISGPADPYRLTRQTFHLARLPIPDPIAYPLAWLTTRVYLRPRGHQVADISAAIAIARYRGPILLVHGDDDQVVPFSHMARLAAAARRGRSAEAHPAPIETLHIPGGHHSWLHEDATYRRTVARFLAQTLGTRLTPDEAGAVAASTGAPRLPDREAGFGALESTAGGFRSLAEVALPGATRRPDPTDGTIDLAPAIAGRTEEDTTDG